MPTGYTAGILDGDIKNFRQFAILCMRNFGATMHMRDESLSVEYTPRTPSDYHTKAIKEAKQLIADSEKLSDFEIVAQRRAKLLNDKEYHLQAIAKAKEGAETLDRFIVEARKYQPPTEEHEGIKEFMVSQLVETKKFDCDRSYHHDNLAEIEKELANLSPLVLRFQMTQKATKDLQYHLKEYTNEVERCKESNEWVQKFLDSL